jgi:transposase
MPETASGSAGRPDAVQLEQSAAGGGDQLGEFLLRDLDLLVDDDQFVDQLRRQPAAGLADHVTRPDAGEQGAGLLGGQVFLRAAGDEFEQQGVQPVDDVGAGTAELVAAVGQQPQRDLGVIGLHGGLPRHVDISAANVNDHRMLEDMVDGVRPVRQPIGRPRKRPAKLHGDKGYDYPGCRELLRERNIVARIARKGIESSKRLGRHRYVIERCLEWTTRFRRLVRRYDRKASHFLGFLRLACAVICYRRADRLNLVNCSNPN